MVYLLLGQLYSIPVAFINLYNFLKTTKVEYNIQKNLLEPENKKFQNPPKRDIYGKYLYNTIFSGLHKRNIDDKYRYIKLVAFCSIFIKWIYGSIFYPFYIGQIISYDYYDKLYNNVSYNEILFEQLHLYSKINIYTYCGK